MASKAARSLTQTSHFRRLWRTNWGGGLISSTIPAMAGSGDLTPFNIEYLLRDLESRFGIETSLWELPFALFPSRQFLDSVEDYWERGPGAQSTPFADSCTISGSMVGTCRDALSKSAASCRALIDQPRDNFLDQMIENSRARGSSRLSQLAGAFVAYDLFLMPLSRSAMITMMAKMPA